MTHHASRCVCDFDFRRSNELTTTGGTDESHRASGEIVGDALGGDAYREFTVSTLASAQRVDSLLLKGVLGLFGIKCKLLSYNAPLFT